MWFGPKYIHRHLLDQVYEPGLVIKFFLFLANSWLMTEPQVAQLHYDKEFIPRSLVFLLSWQTYIF